MAYDDDYRELIENARNAVRDLLDESEHDAWNPCRVAYGSLRDALDSDDAERIRVAAAGQKTAAKQANDQAWQEHYTQEQHWRKMPQEARENLLLDALGDGSLIASELANRMCRELLRRQGWERLVLPSSGHELDPISTEDARRVALRLLAAGQLERTVKPKGKLQAVQHFSRKRELDGPIADLERSYHGAAEAGGR